MFLSICKKLLLRPLVIKHSKAKKIMKKQAFKVLTEQCLTDLLLVYQAPQ
jgi:hypothetical protein